MTESQSTPDRRATSVALFGFGLQVLMSAALAVAAFLAGDAKQGPSDPLLAAALFSFIGVPIWLVLYITYRQIARVRAEELESDELRRQREEGTSTAIFEVEQEELLVERSHLAFLARWILPACTLFVAIGLLLFELFGWGWKISTAFSADSGIGQTQNGMVYMLIAVASAVGSYFFACWTLELAKLPEWGLLRAGAVTILTTGVACLLVSLALLFTNTLSWAEPLATVVIRVAMVVIAIEFIANYILDFYRPRTNELVSRPSFDSRLMGLISEPSSFAKSIADAINYQFGFEVSGTWFYQLLQRWMLPLAVVTIVLVLLLSSLVIVDVQEQVIVERLGRPIMASGSDTPKVYGPGPHLKLPWPIDVTYRAPVKQINELIVGEKIDDGTDDQGEGKAITWTEQHKFVPELMIVVAAPDAMSEQEAKARKAGELTSDTGGETESVAVSLLKVSVPIEYRIADIHKYLYNYDSPERVMEGVVYQILTDYASRVDIDTMIGPGRQKLNRELFVRFSEKIEELDLGIELVFVGIRGAHPPADENVAKTFQNVVNAETNMQAQINRARGEAHKLLTEAAGSLERANELDDAIGALSAAEASEGVTSKTYIAAKQRVDELLIGNPEKSIPPTTGEAATMILDARAKGEELLADVRNKQLRFQAELAAYEAAPQIYMTRQWLSLYTDLDDIRKFLIIGDKSNVVLIVEGQDEDNLDTVLNSAYMEQANSGM